MKLTNIFLNNENDKRTLLNILNENLNGNLTDEDAENQINTLVGNNEEDINIQLKNIVFVSILSKQEFDKYIINSTFSGSITANDVNVWHWFKSLSIYAWVYFGGSAGSYSTAKNYKAFPDTGRLINQDNYRYPYESESRWSAGGNGWCTWNYNVQTTHYSELSSTNINDSFNSRSVKGQYDVYSGDTNTGGGISTFRSVWSYQSIDLRNAVVTKNTANKIYNLVTKPRSGSNGFIRMDISLQPSFRPVFRFIDNKHSHGVFY